MAGGAVGGALHRRQLPGGGRHLVVLAHEPRRAGDAVLGRLLARALAGAGVRGEPGRQLLRAWPGRARRRCRSGAAGCSSGAATTPPAAGRAGRPGGRRRIPAGTCGSSGTRAARWSLVGQRGAAPGRRRRAGHDSGRRTWRDGDAAWQVRPAVTMSAQASWLERQQPAQHVGLLGRRCIRGRARRCSCGGTTSRPSRASVKRSALKAGASGPIGLPVAGVLAGLRRHGAVADGATPFRPWRVVKNCWPRSGTAGGPGLGL